MEVRDLPLVGWVVESGAEDRVFDALLLAGPPIVVLVAVLGRSVVSYAVVGLYLLAFVGHVVYRGIRSPSE